VLKNGKGKACSPREWRAEKRLPKEAGKEKGTFFYQDRLQRGGHEKGGKPARKGNPKRTFHPGKLGGLEKKARGGRVREKR